MVSKAVQSTARTKAVSETLRAVRRHRRLSVIDVANRMALAKRTYEYFESGKGVLDFNRLAAFAAATECDYLGLVLAIYIGKPDLAVRVADNRALSVFAIELTEFNTGFGDGIALLEVGLLFSRYRALFGDLGQDVRERQSSAKAWRGRDLPRVEDADPDETEHPAKDLET